jgi:hypothetical protein
VPPRRTRWRLPHLGYIGDAESRSEILDNQGPWCGSSRYMLRSWWWCCVASAGLWLGRHSHSLALLGPTPGAGASWFGAALSWASFFACALSLYVSSGILTMSLADAHVFVMFFSDNEQVCPPLPFPSCSTKPWKWGGEGWGSLICCLWYPFDGSTSPIYMTFSLPRCRLGMLLPLLCTCHPSFCHCKNYYVVPLLFWVLVFCCAKD